MSFAVWFVEYRYYFLGFTVLLLAFAHWQHHRRGERASRVDKVMLYGSTVMSVGLIGYAMVAH